MKCLLQVFLRYYHVDELSASLQSSVTLVTTCQAYVRGLLTRRSYQRERARRMCDTLQQLVLSISSGLVGVQRTLCDDDKRRQIAKV